MANMKQRVTCSRSKPPPACTPCYGLGKTRGQMNVDNQQITSVHTMQAQDSHKGSGDSSGNVSTFGEKTSSVGQITATTKEVSECLSGWLAYLKMLNGLCSAGSRLSHSLGILVQDTSSPCHAIASQCHATWEELVKATAMASSAVKSQVVATLQELNTSSEAETDTPRTFDSNQQVVCGSLMTFINLQYQFCVACCEFFGAMASSNCCQTGEITQSRHDPDCSVGILQQCFARLYSPVPPPVPSTPGSHRPVRSPLHFPLCSIQGPQRRWSEAAAGEVGAETTDSTMRRWSMPWESSRLAEHHTAWHGRLNPTSKLTVPSASSQDRSRSTTPDSVWHATLASQDELQEVIQLLSCRPGASQSTQLYHPSQHLPGVTLTSCPYDGPVADGGMWSDGGTLEDRGGGSASARRGSSSPHQQQQQSNWWGEQENQSTSGEKSYDLYQATLDPGTLASRKSSSSTDSSSSHSLHSRSTTGSEGGAEVKSHLYSMWSGSELTFMKLSESSEPTEKLGAPSSSSKRIPLTDSPHAHYSSSK